MKNTLDRSTTIKLLALLLCAYIHQSQQLIKEHKQSVAILNHAKAWRKKKRIPWSYVDNMLNDRQFRRMFRMTRECFALLCENIKVAVGESVLSLKYTLLPFSIIQVTFIMLTLKHHCISQIIPY